MTLFTHLILDGFGWLLLEGVAITGVFVFR